eukprot:g7877.t1
MKKFSIISFAVHLVLVSATKATKASGGPYVDVTDTRDPDDPTLPYFLGGRPAPLQEHLYRSSAEPSRHIASGPGLREATTGCPASFTIELFNDTGLPILGPWIVNELNFMYVWIANEDQILIAEVADNGNGTLTATYESLFPGDYLVHVEEVWLGDRGEGKPVLNSPFRLTVTGAPKLNVDDLPACASTEGDISDLFWQPGTWVSSNIASGVHGVTRYGWVFQPKNCVLDTFSYEDLTYLASSEQPTWLLVLGDSVQRGVFLILVDMILAEGQKQNLSSSTITKCWGYAEVRVGNLRVTYQDMRLRSYNKPGQKVICHNEKLVSGGSAEFVRSCREFFSSTVFAKGKLWPTAILAPSKLDGGANLDVEVPLEALPPDWRGTLLFVDHISGLGKNWHQRNPTMTHFEDVGISPRPGAPPFGLAELDQIRRYKELDPRVSFVSAFPIYQPMLFENEATCKTGSRRYGANQHLHCVPDPSRTYNGALMVQSTVAEMVANMLISKSVGPKASLRSTFKSIPDTTFESIPDTFEDVATPGTTFNVCYDCPTSLLPFHVKPSPEVVCTAVDALPPNSENTFHVWDGELCPAWCMNQAPTSQADTQSGPVDVRDCKVAFSP